MIRSNEEIINLISQRIGDDNSDEAISLLEDISDTLNDYNARTKDATDWKKRYEDNDKEWRDKYKERFMSGDSNDDEDDFEEPETKKYTFDSLFKEG